MSVEYSVSPAIFSLCNPATPVNLVDLGFMSARSQLLEIAAFLDRVNRVEQTSDFRYQALVTALPILANKGSSRVADVLHHLSDPTTEPIHEAHIQGASGAWQKSEI